MRAAMSAVRMLELPCDAKNKGSGAAWLQLGAELDDLTWTRRRRRG